MSPRQDGKLSRHVSREASWKGNSRQLSSLWKGTEPGRVRMLVGVLGAYPRISWEERMTDRQTLGELMPGIPGLQTRLLGQVLRF